MALAMKNIRTRPIILSLCSFIFMIIYTRVGEYSEMLSDKFRGNAIIDASNPIYMFDDHPTDAIASPLFSLAVTNDCIDNMTVVRHFSTFRVLKYEKLCLWSYS